MFARIGDALIWIGCFLAGCSVILIFEHDHCVMRIAKGFLFVWGFLSGFLIARSLAKPENPYLLETYKRQQKLLDQCVGFIERLGRDSMTSFEQFIENFYEGTGIDRHVMTSKADGEPVLRIGDDDVMVKVDLKCAQEEGMPAALERAKLEWQRIKAEQ